jgi:hypothetical protein
MHGMYSIPYNIYKISFNYFIYLLLKIYEYISYIKNVVKKIFKKKKFKKNRMHGTKVL